MSTLQSETKCPSCGGQLTRGVSQELCTEPHVGRLETHVELGAGLQFRTFPLTRYSLYPIASNTRAYWLRTGDGPPILVDSFTGEPVPEERRGEPLTYFVEQFQRICPGTQLKAIFSCADAGVNEYRAILAQEELIAIPHSIPKLTKPRPWLVCYKTGIIRAERLCVEGVVQDRQCRPVRVSHESSPHGTNALLPDIRWAITGLPVIVAGRPDEEVIYREDDDLRHPFLTPQKDGLYILERALLEARERGWDPSEPLDVDLSLYGDLPPTFEALFRAGYRQVFETPKRVGEFQIIGRNRILCCPQESGYGVSMLGLCKDGSLGSYIGKARPTDRGYFSPSVRDQIRMVVPYFSDAWILDEGLDPTFYDLGIPPWEFPVRGRPNGRLSAVIGLYEP